MNVTLTDNDIAVLESLLRDGRKSFRQISREIGLSTPTVKARFMRLVNMGIIQSVSPIIDLDKLSYQTKKNIQTNEAFDSIVRHGRQLDSNKKLMTKLESDKRMKVELNCDYCKTPLFAKMHTLKFAIFERFFCCKECKIAYKKRNAGRIESIIKRYQKSNSRRVSS
jgi:Lrp/AsnC family leucine-responsive transcriptional regulator